MSSESLPDDRRNHPRERHQRPDRNPQARRQSLKRRFSRTPEEVGGVNHVDVTDRAEADATRVTWPVETMGWMYEKYDPKDDSFGWL